ncbi:hypothetical protein MXB_2561 [Myxobolus squamalis]|nr:hypothetical protein MXB_2561 [Myxobolus squamalis]
MISDKNIFIAELDYEGRPFPQSDFYQIQLHSHLNFSNLFAFDFHNKRIFTIENSVVLSVLELQKPRNWIHNELYFFHSTITWIGYSRNFDSFYYLTSRNELYKLSFNTGYVMLVLKEISSAAFYSDQRLISYVTLNNRICYGEIEFSIKCTSSPANVLKYMVAIDDPSFHILHFLNNSLLIFHSNSSNLFSKPILVLDGVLSFDIQDKNIYYFQRGVFFLRSLDQIDKFYKVLQNNDFRNIKIFVLRGNSRDKNNLCRHNTCNYVCTPYGDDRNLCICPDGSTLEGNSTCVCNINSPNCFGKLCSGFHCLNDRCLIDKVRCDGKNDCGDNSDEHQCQGIVLCLIAVICTNGTHLCGGLCLPSDIIC